MFSVGTKYVVFLQYISSMCAVFSCICRMLGLDLVVRDEQGNILNPDNTSVVELYKQVCAI